jgi:hypothetical protein
MGIVLLLQLDGKLPNIALMRIAAHHRDRGDEVVLRRAGNAVALEPQLGESWGAVYASLIFERSRTLADRVLRAYPGAHVGGTGWDLTSTLEHLGITARRQDYSVYPTYQQSLGFSLRGCRLECEFCVVPRKEGAISDERSIAEIWRGDPWPRELVLLDNDFFGGAAWRARIREIVDGRFRVCFSQGINARMLNNETAEAIASVDYRDSTMKERRIYTAWDSRKDERTLFRGLEALVRHGVKPRHIMVYMLVGFWPGETHEDRDYRRQQLRAFGALPYPMPYTRSAELVGFQRWVIGGYDKGIPWDEWSRGKWQPSGLTRRSSQLALLDGAT